MSCQPCQRERTFIMVKPDGVHRGVVGEIIKRFEQKGFKMVAMKFVWPSDDIIKQHYDEHREKPFFQKIIKYMTAGPVVPMVWEGKSVVNTGRTMLGATDPLKSNPGTIRGDFGIDVGRNICHGSDGPESAEREIALWFTASELVKWVPAEDAWVYE